MDRPIDDAASRTFELSGGALCLDFANTWEDRDRPEEEHLRGYADLLEFARQAGVLTPDEHSELARRAAGSDGGGDAAFAAAREVREAIYRLFSAIARGERPPSTGLRADLERLNEVLPPALAGLCLEPAEGRFAWVQTDLADSLDAPLHPIVRSAAELLTSDRLDRVRECDGARCTWLFLDQSRNRSRRWCSMETCGNRAKVRRHYRRHGRDSDRDGG